jgi:VWFA-related protein
MHLRLSRFPEFATLFLAAVAVYAQTSAPASVSDQGKEHPVIKSKVNIVLVDVVVTKGKGEPVSGLRQEDFKVTEEGKAQTISFFEEHRGALPTAGSQALPPHVFANDPSIKTADSVNVLLLDWLNTQPQDQPYVRSEITKYLRSMTPGMRMAIFSLGARLHMVQGFTGDPTELLAALDDKKAGAEPPKSPLLSTAQQSAAEQAIIEMMIMNQASPAAVEAVRQEIAQSSGSRVESRISLTLRALQQLARYLSSFPGRKNVIWFSGSFPVGIFPDAGLPRQYQTDVQQAADQLTADQVAIYPVAAVGLTGAVGFDPTADGSRRRSPTPNVREGTTEHLSDQFAMETLAKDTGGHAFYDTNGLTEAVSHAVNDGSHFYTLAYTPTDMKADGKYRRIQVKVAGGSYRLDYRRGYYAADEGMERAPEQTPEGDALLPLLGFGMPDFAQILFKARVLPSDPQPEAGAARAGSKADLKGPLTRYRVDFAISAKELKLDASPDGMRHGHIEVMLVAYDPDGKPLNLVTAKYNLGLQPQDYADAQRQGLQVPAELDVPAGEVFLRAGIYDLNSHSAGTLGIPLTVAPVPVH